MVERARPPEPLEPIPIYLHAAEPTPVAAPAMPAQPTRVPAFLALGLGGLAFLNGWLPIAGIVLGIPGVLVAAIAILQKQPKRYAVTGLVLGAIGTLSSALATYFLLN